MSEKINWDELRKKVDEDLQKDIDDEVNNVNSINAKFEGDKSFITLNTRSVYMDPFNAWARKEEDDLTDLDDDDQDFEDEGGDLPEISPKKISDIAWNNHNNLYEISCKHITKANRSNECYIYPLGDKQELYLCCDCHSELAPRILEQLATELFIK